MKVLFVLVSLMLVLPESSFAFGRGRSNGGGGNPVPAPTAAPTATPVVVNPPSNDDTQTGGLDVVIHEYKNYDAQEAAKLEAARVLLKKVVNSEEFKQRVIHFTYLGQETYVQNNGLTNLQIYNAIMAGAEQLPQATAANHTMDLYTQLYTSSWFGRNVIGYTDPSTHTIFMNSYFYDYAAPSGIAGNMMHEWLHKIGFDHDYNSTARRPSSVPYAIGDIAEEIAGKQ